MASATWTTGIRFGTVGARVQGAMCEITTFRADRYDGVTRNPEVAFGDSLADDLRRRDFTMNAMAAVGDRRPACSATPTAGWPISAAASCARPGTPEESFGDDPLRMLRGARFVSTLGVSVAPEVLRGHDERWPASCGASPPSACCAELTKLLLGANPRGGLEVLVETGLADVVLPELPALRMSADEHGQHKDVYAHTLQVLEQAIDLETDGPDLVAALGGAAARRRQARHPRVRRRGPGHLPPPRGRRLSGWPASDSRRCGRATS